MLSSVSPAVCTEGKLIFRFGVFVQEADTGMAGSMSLARQRPAWMTSGKATPTGTLLMVKVPSAALMVPTSGEPPGGVEGVMQATPGVNTGSGALGMKT